MARAEPELRPRRITFRIRSPLPVPGHLKSIPGPAVGFWPTTSLTRSISWHMSPKLVSSQLRVGRLRICKH